MSRPLGLNTLSHAELDARDRAFDALAQMRRRGLSLKAASKEAGTAPRTVRRYADSALEQRGRRWHAKPTDRLQRRQITFVVVGTHGGAQRALVETRSSKQASEIGTHNADISALLSVRTSPEVREAARARLAARHGKRAGRTATLPDGSIIGDPQFFGTPEELVDLYDTIDLGDIDYGSSASVGALR